MAELLVYAARSRANAARAHLAGACAATGLSVRMEVLGTGALYQRLGPRRAPPVPDLTWWFGPFAATAAAADGVVQNVQMIEASPIRVSGPSVQSLNDLAGVPRLALADPERSEIGMAILLGSLDSARQTQGDPELAWRWWQQRASAGLLLAEDEAGALAMVQSGAATHALTLSSDGAPLTELATVPHAVALAANSRNVSDASRLLEWITAQRSAPSSLDVAWCTQSYNTTRQRWAQSGFAPSLLSG